MDCDPLFFKTIEPVAISTLLTLRSVVISTLLGNPTVIVPELSPTSTSLDVPEKVIVPPKAVAVELEPSVTVIDELANFPFAIEPANILLVIALEPITKSIVPSESS